MQYKYLFLFLITYLEINFSILFSLDRLDQ